MIIYRLVGAGRWALLFVVTAGVSAFAWYGTRWQFGDMIGEMVSPLAHDAAEAARTAIELAPANSRGHRLAGAVDLGFIDPTHLPSAVMHFETAARLSPHDHNTWTALGRAYENTGETERARAAMERAAELAPEHVIPRWRLGNFFLRRGNADAALEQLRLAAKHDSPYRLQVFGVSWDLLGNDPVVLERLAPRTPDGLASLAFFYGLRNRPAEALRAWNSIDENEKERFQRRAADIAVNLHKRSSFRVALEFARQSGLSSSGRTDTVTNGGFESVVQAGEDPPLFDWILQRTDGKVDITTDGSVRHGGSRSLRFAFRNYARPGLDELHQIVAVQPGSRYRLSAWVRTENLRSGSMPFLEILNPRWQRVAVTPAATAGTNDWQQLAIEFQAPTEGDGIVIRTSRELCATGECPIAGTLWLDDIELTRL